MRKSLSLVSATSLSLAIALFLSHVLFCQSSSLCQNASCGIFSNISYPFGLSSSSPGGPDSRCGHPDFQIHCESDTPHLKINSVDYTILNFSRTQLRIANDAVLKKPSCSLPDASVNLSFSPFILTSSYRTLLLGLGCNIYPIPSLLCNNTPWAWTFPPLPFPAINCNPISVPIEASIEPIASLIEKALQKGFQVEWKEEDEAFKDCRNCIAQDGICGFNASFPFICFVPEKTNSSSNGSSTENKKPIPPSPPYTPQDRNKSDTPRPSPLLVPPKRHKSYTGVIIGVCVGSALLIATAWVLAFLRHRRAREPERLESGFDSGDDKHTELSGLPSKRGSLMFFTYQELEQATDFFDVKRELGDGGFASVYLGKLWNGRLVAVKKLFHDNCKRVEQFGNEVRILSSLNHPNLVLLIGYCQYRRELLLVYEYASNGTLADHLHGESNGRGLSWENRLRIGLETAQALAYLHFCVEPPIVHRDVKSSNILLDENFRAKVADFGLSRLVPVEATHVSTGPQGTPGYLDPDYHHCYRLTDKSDVYSFGVVLAELISAKKAVDISRDKKEVGLADLAVSKIQCGALHELVDPNLEIETNPLVKEMVSRVAELAFRCLASEKDDRPNMTEVAAQLQQIKEFGHRGSPGTVPPTCFNSFDSNQETKKLLGHTYTSSRSSVQETWFSTSTSPDSNSSTL